jgi:hypothetical protein
VSAAISAAAWPGKAGSACAAFPAIPARLAAAPAPPCAGAGVAVNERGGGGDGGEQRCDSDRQSGQRLRRRTAPRCCSAIIAGRVLQRVRRQPRASRSTSAANTLTAL